jgi:DNA-directed RNA polymerase subunit delta
LTRGQANLETPPAPSGQCHFKPIRNAQKPCDSVKVNEWGFCSRHVRTNQAKAAKEQYDEFIEQQRKLQLQELDEELQNISSGDEEEERLTIRPNRWGRFEEPNTGIVFDPDTSLAKGVQGADGKLLDLDEEAIKQCIEHGWDYLIRPPKAKKVDVSVEEVEEEKPDDLEEEDDDEELVEEEESLVDGEESLVEEGEEELEEPAEDEEEEEEEEED